MTSIILVSHSRKITDGLKEMIHQMMGSSDNVKIFSVGGTTDNRIGTDPIAIYDAIQDSADVAEQILIFTDIGSAILSAETAIDMLDENLVKKIHLINAPLVEGAFVASIQASIGSNVDDILAELAKI